VLWITGRSTKSGASLCDQGRGGMRLNCIMCTLDKANKSHTGTQRLLLTTKAVVVEGAPSKMSLIIVCHSTLHQNDAERSHFLRDNCEISEDLRDI
jgi:hypothetical protein